MINRFLDTYKEKPDEELLDYSAGIVNVHDNEFVVDRQQAGAEETFSIGQPIYDKEANLLGYLGIGIFDHLDYANTNRRIPVEYWKICLPTEYCARGKGIFTYWQMKYKADDINNID